MKITTWNLSVSKAQAVILGDEDRGDAISGFAPQDSPGFRVVDGTAKPPLASSRWRFIASI
jgi:hypothetical protein